MSTNNFDALIERTTNNIVCKLLKNDLIYPNDKKKVEKIVKPQLSFFSKSVMIQKHNEFLFEKNNKKIIKSEKISKFDDHNAIDGKIIQDFRDIFHQFFTRMRRNTLSTSDVNYNIDFNIYDNSYYDSNNMVEKNEHAANFDICFNINYITKTVQVFYIKISGKFDIITYETLMKLFKGCLYEYIRINRQNNPNEFVLKREECKEEPQKCDCNDVKSSFDFKQPFDVNKIPISVLVDYLDDLSKDISHNFANVVDEIEYLNERLSNIEKKFD